MIKHLEILPFHSTGAVCKTLLSFLISAFSACYKQLNVLHLKHSYVILILCTPCSFLCWWKHEVCTSKGLLGLKSEKWQFDSTQTQQNMRQAAVKLLSCLSQEFFTLFWSHYMSCQSYILGEIQKEEWAQSATTTQSDFVDGESQRKWGGAGIWFRWKLPIHCSQIAFEANKMMVSHLSQCVLPHTTGERFVNIQPSMVISETAPVYSSQFTPQWNMQVYIYTIL